MQHKPIWFIGNAAGSGRVKQANVLLKVAESMARATAHPSPEFISSKDVRGTEVYGSGGKNIGAIDHLIIIDKVSGRVAYAAMSFVGIRRIG